MNHFIFIYTSLQTQINRSTFFGIQQIVTFILSIVHAKVFTNKLCSRMYLHAQVSSSHRIQKIETNWEILTKACLYRFTQQFSRFQQHQIHRRQFKAYTVHFKIKTVFLGNTIETPTIILLFRIQPAHLFHPLSTPRSRIKERNHTERSLNRFFYTLEKSFLINQPRLIGNMSIQPEVYPAEQTFFIPIKYSPIVEIASLILQRYSIFTIIHS